MLKNRRQLTGAWSVAASGLAILLPLSSLVYALQILPALGVVIYKEQFLVWFLTLALLLVFLLVRPSGKPATPGQDSERVPWYDCVLLLATLAAGGYTTARYHVLLPEIGLLTTDKVLASTVGIALLLEAARRCAGMAMLSIGALALAYAYFGHYLGGLLETRVIRFDRLMLYNYMGQDAVHGTPLFVAATIVAAFMLFGQLLFATGAGQAISDLGFALLGRRRGGPAKVSVVASALFGSLSGSASANVATTGMITIPMIKRSGYAPHQAAAIEAVASTGGLILPPIMAATGFIMAEFLGVPYSEVALAATWPALLFYLCVFVQVDLEAAKTAIHGMAQPDLPTLKAALKSVAPVVLPIAVLIYSLFGRFQSAETSAFLATGTAFVMSLLLPSMRQTLQRYLEVLVSTGEAVVYIAIVCAVAGLVIGCLGLTGLASNFSQALVSLAGGQVWLLLLLAALGSIVLGMGVPVTATYIILVILVGPALIDLGIPDLAAHMFVFYFGTLSFLTPPVCISVFVAAALAEASPMRTAWFAMRLAVVAYLVPFFFIFNRAYLWEATAAETANAMLGSVAGVYLLSVGLVGYLRGRLHMGLRAVALAAGLGALQWGASSWVFASVAWLVIGVLLVSGPVRAKVLPQRG